MKLNQNFRVDWSEFSTVKQTISSIWTWDYSARLLGCFAAALL